MNSIGRWNLLDDQPDADGITCRGTVRHISTTRTHRSVGRCAYCPAAIGGEGCVASFGCIVTVAGGNHQKGATLATQLSYPSSITVFPSVRNGDDRC